jgi:CheY-like chemotaxis protein
MTIGIDPGMKGLLLGVSNLPTSVLSGLRILLLEDETLIAMDVELLCRDHGAADVIAKRDVAELDEEGLLASFDVAIIDLVLSGASTLPFAERLKQMGRPFVFASGYVDRNSALGDFPGVPVVGKPYSGADLVEAVAAAVGRRQEAGTD